MTRSAQLAGAAATAAILIFTGVLLLGGEDHENTGGRPLVLGQLPRQFVGIVSEDAFAGGAAYRERALADQADLGIGLVRQTFDWSLIETARGRYEFGHYDGYVADLARHRLALLPLLFGVPRFRSSAPARGARRGTYPPRNTEEFAAFAAAVADRYGPAGTFWDERPDLPRLPVRTWQIWNEPSLPAFWASGPSPAEYARLLGAAGRAIRRADPDATIVTAGLPESRLGMPFADFVEGLYEAGASDSFDALAIHPYARDVEGVIEAVRAARRLMDRNGDRHKAIWVTEVGWASDGPESPFTVGERGQAERIRRLVPRLAAERDALGIRGVVYFNWRDAPPFPGGEDFWGLHTGLLDIDGRPKPALRAFEAGVRTARR